MATNVQIDGAWTLQQTDTSFQGRQKELAMLVAGASGDPTVARSGVIPRVSTSGVCQDFLVKQRSDVGSLKVDVLSGAAVINRTGQGPYILYNTQTRTPTLTAANATNGRIDRIVLHAYDIALGDSNPNSAGVYAAYVEVVTGTPAGSPVAPSVPTNCISLAQCLVPANAANSNLITVTPERTSTGLQGAMRWMLEGDAATGTTPAAFLDGEIRWREGSGGTSGLAEMWLNGAWQTALTMGSFTAYTPTWTMASATGNPAGRWWSSGKLIVCLAQFVATTGVSLGTGNIQFTVPVASTGAGFAAWQGSCFITSGTGTPYILPCTLGQGTTTATIFGFSNAATGALTTPGTAGVVFANTGTMSAWLAYERA